MPGFLAMCDEWSTGGENGQYTLYCVLFFYACLFSWSARRGMVRAREKTLSQFRTVPIQEQGNF
jgi:hypothetical protein